MVLLIVLILFSGCISNTSKEKPTENGINEPELGKFNIFYDIDPEKISLKLSDVTLDFNSLAPSDPINPEGLKVFLSPDNKKWLVQSIDIYENTSKANNEYLNILQKQFEKYNKNSSQYLTFLDLVGKSSSTLYDQNYCSEETFFQISNIVIGVILTDFHETCSIQPQDTITFAKIIEIKTLQIK
ncbi:MAG: hypothetical protein Q8N60_02260 [Candidatus Diapherotrites archaeon]|nr:hypothetical protein [Candidatus Diapherotrites archaeon]